MSSYEFSATSRPGGANLKRKGSGDDCKVERKRSKFNTMETPVFYEEIAVPKSSRTTTERRLELDFHVGEQTAKVSTRARKEPKHTVSSAVYRVENQGKLPRKNLPKRRDLRDGLSYNRTNVEVEMQRQGKRTRRETPQPFDFRATLDDNNYKKSSRNARPAGSSGFSGPLYKQHQLLGDSQLMRFSKTLLGHKQTTEYIGKKCIRRVGFCVSGQTIGELNSLLQKNRHELQSNVVVMIGTNDLLRGRSYREMRVDFEALLETLLKKCSKVVLLTLPPIPFLGKEHLAQLRWFNDVIKDQHDGREVFVADLCHYLIYRDHIFDKYYEEVYGRGPRVDMVHLNRKGFELLEDVLHMDYFDVHCL